MLPKSDDKGKAPADKQESCRATRGRSSGLHITEPEGDEMLRRMMEDDNNKEEDQSDEAWKYIPISPRIPNTGAGTSQPDFINLRPPVNKGEIDPDQVDQWIKEIEKTLNVLYFTAWQMVRMIANMLKEKARSSELNYITTHSQSKKRLRTNNINEQSQKKSKVQGKEKSEDDKKKKTIPQCPKCQKFHYNECLKGKGLCFKCGKGGHVAKACRAKVVACFTCGQKGHRSSECPQKQQHAPQQIHTESARAREYTLADENIKDDPDVMTGKMSFWPLSHGLN